jgi:hypothetical protein
MKRLVFASAVIVAALYNQIAHAAAPAECFANPGAVYSAHPNATHVSYIVRGKKSGSAGRCWFADAFKAQTQADAKPARRAVAMVAETSTLRPSITVSAREPRATAIVAPTLQSRTAAVALASPAVIAQLPRGLLPATRIAVNAQEFGRQEFGQSRLVDETPADFESRFSASGYDAQKRR